MLLDRSEKPRPLKLNKATLGWQFHWALPFQLMACSPQREPHGSVLVIIFVLGGKKAPPPIPGTWAAPMSCTTTWPRKPAKQIWLCHSFCFDLGYLRLADPKNPTFIFLKVLLNQQTQGRRSGIYSEIVITSMDLFRILQAPGCWTSESLVIMMLSSEYPRSTVRPPLTVFPTHVCHSS